MTTRDRRYNATRKGQLRNKRFEASAKRRAYQRKWMKRYRARQKRERG